jgi:type II secretory pathway pseudopilin PulG
MNQNTTIKIMSNFISLFLYKANKYLFKFVFNLMKQASMEETKEIRLGNERGTELMACHAKAERLEGGGISLRSMRGFTLTQTLMVTALIIVAASAAVPVITSSVENAQAETAMQNIVQEMRRARESAMDWRRVHVITFTSPGTISIVRKETGGNPDVTVSTMNLPSNLQFNRNGISSTPDSLSTSAAADFCGSNSVNFNPDGTGTTTAGQICNGAVFVCVSGKLKTTRAATLFGSTGRVKGFRYRQSGGSWVWQ